MVFSMMNIPIINSSRVGFGGWQLGGHGWGKISKFEMRRAILRAIELGINLFDTAPIYGLGQSEELLGETLGAKRKDVLIATKFGLTWEQSGTFQKYVDCSPANIIREVGMSLKRLKTDYIDLYQIHWPDPNTPIEDTLDTLNELKQSGEIRHIGCSNFSKENLDEAVQYGLIDTAQVRYNLIDRDVEKNIIPYCHNKGISVLTHSSLANGLLSGKYDTKSTFEVGDYRNRDGYYFTSNSLTNYFAIVERVKFVAKKLNKTPSQIALKWVLQNPSVTTALVGIKSVHQIEENALVDGFSISKDDYEYLNRQPIL